MGNNDTYFNGLSIIKDDPEADIIQFLEHIKKFSLAVEQEHEKTCGTINDILMEKTVNFIVSDCDQK